MAQCYTCKHWFAWKVMNAGHFIHNKLDFDERNVHPQCVQCNLWKHGNLGRYAYYLIKEYGVKWVERLEYDASCKGNDYTRQELIELDLYYKQKLNELS